MTFGLLSIASLRSSAVIPSGKREGGQGRPSARGFGKKDAQREKLASVIAITKKSSESLSATSDTPCLIASVLRELVSASVAPEADGARRTDRVVPLKKGAEDQYDEVRSEGKFLTAQAYWGLH